MIIDYTKQHELINVFKVTDKITIIGAGALGSWIAFILLKMGFTNINVIDYDTIEEHNIPNQLFMESQIGKTKVEALEEIYNNFFNDDVLRLSTTCGRIDADSSKPHDIIFCAVDSMSSRKEIYENLFKYNPKAKLWIEGRLSIYGAYIYTLKTGNFNACLKYEDTLYDDTETEVSACGVSQTALPAAINAATIMVMQMIEYYNSDKVINKIEYSIPFMTAMTDSW